MICLFCEKRLHKDEAQDFVCICNKCFETLEKNEIRMVQMICELKDDLKKERKK